LAEEGLDGVEVLLADLGVSSMQIDDPARGFSFRHDGPLDMRMDRRLRRTAADLLATLPEARLAEALAELADEPAADRIARELVRRRERSPIARTRDLAAVVMAAQGYDAARWRREARPGALHPAARTFQALRLLVNDEMGALDRLLAVLPSVVKPGGRVAILTFHSGEDRRVKHAFRDGLRDGVWAEVAPDPVRAGPDEVRSNPRAAPAKLRWAVRAL
jgi:16S rRNA (cytosine1402-N4)-methyltransferase